MKLLIGWEGILSEEKHDFREGILKTFVNVGRMKKEDIDFEGNLNEIFKRVETGVYDALICNEKLENGRNMGQKGLVRCLEHVQQVVILMEPKKKGSLKLLNFCRDSYFNVLFTSDFTAGNVFKLLKEGRTKEEAYSYYGVEEPKKESASEEVAVWEEAIEVAAETKGKEHSRESYREKIEAINHDTADLLVPVVDTFDEKLPDAKDDAEYLRYLTSAEEECCMGMEIENEVDELDGYVDQLIHHFVQEDPTWISNIENGIAGKDEFSLILLREIDRFNLSVEEEAQIYDRFSRFMWGYDIIEPFIEDMTVSDIKITDTDKIIIKKEGKSHFSKRFFRSREHYNAFVNHVCNKNHIIINEKQADQTFFDKKTSEKAILRFVLSSEHINSSAMPSICIRKTLKVKYSILDLIDKGMMDAKTAAMLVDKVRQGYSFIFCGEMSSGKTSLLNTLFEFIPYNRSGLCIQENEELFADKHPNFIFQNIAHSSDGQVVFDLRYLSTFGLLMDISYFIVGELKGPEAKYFIDQVYANTTCWATVHCPSSVDALPRIVDLAKYEADYSEEALLKRLASQKLGVVFIDHFKVREISYVKGFDTASGEVIYDKHVIA